MRISTCFLLFFSTLFTNAADLVRNPGFEEVDSKGAPLLWNAVDPVYKIENGAGRNGSRGISFNNNDPSFYRFPGQALDLKPGAMYKFSVWVRTEDLKGDESGATVCMEWNDKNGKWMGGAYPNGVKGNNDWVEIKGDAKIPAAAGSVRIHPYVRKGMIGKAWFDDISVSRYIPPAVGSICSSAYRGYAVAGDKIRLRVDLALKDAGLESDAVKGIFVVKGADNKAIRGFKADFIRDDCAGVDFDCASIPAGVFNVEFVLKSADREVGRASCPLKRVDKLPDLPVYIDSHNRTVVDGKPFFPLGMYWSSIKDDLLQTYARGPFNCLMPYGSPNPEQLNMAMNAGMKVIYSVKDIYSGTRWAPANVKTLDDEVRYIKEKVNAYKNHPALLAWYINDELPLNMIDRLSVRRDLMEELDPGHPAWVVLYQYNQVRSYIPSFDIIGTDPYPIPKKPAGTALEWTRVTRDQCWGLRPVWQVPQVFNWGGYKKGEERKKYRAPTLDEMRTMAWQCIAAGANGLIFYSYFDLFKMKENDPFEKRWQEVCAMGEEIKRYIPVILSVDPVPEFSFQKPAQVECRAWSYNGDTYILAVNGGTETTETGIMFNTPVKNLAVEFGDAPVKVESGEYQFKLDPLKPVMVRISK